MAVATAAEISSTDTANGVDAPELRYFVFALFFIFGGITSLNDVILPKLKELFTLNYTQAMLVQFCFFTAYLVIGIPGAQLVKRIGYMRGAIAGLLIMMVGCLLFIPASRTATYGLFLFALFVLASGVVIVQVVANPLISAGLLEPLFLAGRGRSRAQADPEPLEFFACYRDRRHVPMPVRAFLDFIASAVQNHPLLQTPVWSPKT